MDSVNVSSLQDSAISSMQSPISLVAISREIFRRPAKTKHSQSPFMPYLHFLWGMMAYMTYILPLTIWYCLSSDLPNILRLILCGTLSRRWSIINSVRRCMGRSINLQNRIEMNTSFERSAAATDEWYTPKEIIDSLGKFDLDPFTPSLTHHRSYCTLS